MSLLLNMENVYIGITHFKYLLQSSSQQGPSSQELPATSSTHEAGCQTDSAHTETVAIQISAKMRSVGTQLSVGTLRDVHVRSKGMKSRHEISVVAHICIMFLYREIICNCMKDCFE